MAKRCAIHPDTRLVVVEYCPVCRGQQGGGQCRKGHDGCGAIQASTEGSKGAMA
jgi:hypothetical protein